MDVVLAVGAGKLLKLLPGPGRRVLDLSPDRELPGRAGRPSGSTPKWSTGHCCVTNWPGGTRDGVRVREADLRVLPDDHGLVSPPWMARATKAILDYVRPLAVGLDGVTNYGDVERMVSAAGDDRGGRGRARRGPALPAGGVLGPGKVGLADGAPKPHRDLPVLARRFAEDRAAALSGARPLRDALRRPPRRRSSTTPSSSRRWEPTAIARGLADAYRERLDILEMAQAIEEAAAMPLQDRRRASVSRRTARALMREFAARLRAEHAEFARA